MNESDAAKEFVDQGDVLTHQGDAVRAIAAYTEAIRLYPLATAFKGRRSHACNAKN